MITSAETVNRSPGKKFTYLKNNWVLYLFLVPPVVYFLVFKYASMYGVLIAFKDFNIFEGVMNSKWVGLDVFRQVFAMAEFKRALRNTAVLNLLDLVVGFPAPVILAIILSELRQKQFKKLSQTVLYMPHFLSWVIIGGLALQIFAPQSGLINLALKAVGASPVPFLTDKYIWIAVYIFLGVWQSAGWNTIIYLASITGINSELFEAAVVDGAGRLRKIWHITLPGIRPTIVTLLILNMGRMIAIGFDRPYTIGNSLVYDFSDVISTFVYRIGLQSSQFNVATAVGLFQSLVGLIFLLLTNFIAEKLGEQGIW